MLGFGKLLCKSFLIILEMFFFSYFSAGGTNINFQCNGQIFFAFQQKHAL